MYVCFSRQLKAVGHRANLGYNWEKTIEARGEFFVGSVGEGMLAVGFEFEELVAHLKGDFLMFLIFFILHLRLGLVELLS